MNIDPKEILCGLPAIKTRGVLRAMRSRYCCIDDNLSWLLEDITPEKMVEVINSLEGNGFIEKDEDKRFWTLTDKGIRLTTASAAKPVKRETAERIFSGFLERVNSVNKDPHYLYYIDEVIVFGSYLTKKPLISDIDIAIRYSRKHKDDEEHQKLNYQRLNESSNRPTTILERVFWSMILVERFLKSRSRTLSLNDVNDIKEILEKTNHRIVFQRR